MNGGSRTIDELRRYFPKTIQCLDQIIAEGVTLESLLNVLNNLNGDAENKLNKGDPIRTVTNESQFGEELYGYLAVTNSILDEKKKLINTLPNDVKAMVFEAQSEISDARRAIKDIKSILKDLEKNHEVLSKENNELQKLKDEEIRLKNEQIKFEEENNKLKANEIGDIDQLKKIIAGLKREQEALLQQKNDFIKNRQQVEQSLAEERRDLELKRDKAKAEAHKFEKENESLKTEIKNLDDTIVQRKDTQTSYISRIEKLKQALQSLQKDELEKELDNLRSNAEMLLGSWTALSTDTDVKEYFHINSDPEKDILNLYEQVTRDVDSLKECIKNQEKTYKTFLLGWEEKYK